MIQNEGRDRNYMEVNRLINMKLNTRISWGQCQCDWLFFVKHHMREPRQALCLLVWVVTDRSYCQFYWMNRNLTHIKVETLALDSFVSVLCSGCSFSSTIKDYFDWLQLLSLLSLTVCYLNCLNLKVLKKKQLKYFFLNVEMFWGLR